MAPRFRIFPDRISRHFTPQLTMSVCLIAFSSFNYGFDNQGIATSQAMTAYKKQFGKYNATTKTWAIPAYYLSLLNSLNFIGFAFGLYAGSLISARFGRRASMFCMSIWAMMSATVLITSSTIGQVLAGRILNYFYIGMELSTCPVFQAEIVPAPVRGLAVGTYQTSLLMGGIIINSVCKGTSTLNTNAAWRIPNGLFYIVPVTIASCVWFIPESPRWLLLKGREEQALKSLRRLRGSNTYYDPAAELELLKVSLVEEQDKGTYLDLLKGVNRRRTLIAIGMNFFIQATGSPFTAAYGTLFVQSIGTFNAFSYSLMSSCINTFSCAMAILTVDKIGRRTILLIGAVLQMIWLFTMAGVGTVASPSLSIKKLIVACTALSSASLCWSWDPLTYIITTEVSAPRLRDKTQRVASIVNIVTNFVFSFTMPYLLDAPYADLGSKVGFIFGGMAFLAFMFALFCVPEMKGRSLEELNQMFEAGVPSLKFSKYEASSGTGVEISKMEAKQGKEGVEVAVAH